MKPDVAEYRELAKTNQPLDCGDNSCRFITKRTGMRTNGGCRCMTSRQYALSHVLDLLIEAEDLLRDFDTNWDCDTGSGGIHSDHCRSCAAKKLREKM